MTRCPPSASELSPQYALLGFLYFQPRHGYDLHKLLVTNLRELWRISQSQAYTILKRLEREGWISSRPQLQEKRPDRALLSLTELGKNSFEIWLYAPTQGSARAIRVEFLTRLFFASQIGEDACSRLLQEQEAATRRDLARLQKRLAEIPSGQAFNRLGLELRIRQLVTTLEWLDSCEQSLFSPLM
jgi:DNA-binding PadR family transcriptional regulator